MERVETREYNGNRIAIALHDTGSKDIVIFCHGYRSSSIGPNRLFVKVARSLAELGISSLRFDQYGSGNSEGDFLDSSFKDWVALTAEIAKDYLEQGYRVGLFGQSTGGSTVIAAASGVPEITAVVAWVPDPNIESFTPPKSGIIEEGGQIVRASFWQEAHDANLIDKFADITAPTYVVLCTADQYIDQRNRDALSAVAQPHHEIEIFEGYAHSPWTHEQSTGIVEKSVDFIKRSFEGKL